MARVEAAQNRGGVLPLEVSLSILVQALEALEYAHQLRDPLGHALSLVHRDLSPRNIMLDYDGRVKLIDFGIAKGDVDTFKPRAGMLLGTPYYMSPEQAAGMAVDRRSDLYTLAAVFFEMLAGHRLVQAKGRARILISVTRDAAPPICPLNPRLPKAFDALMARALAKHPDDRWPSAAAFRDAVVQAAGPLGSTTSETLGGFVAHPRAPLTCLPHARSSWTSPNPPLPRRGTRPSASDFGPFRTSRTGTPHSPSRSACGARPRSFLKTNGRSCIAISAGLSGPKTST